MVTDLKVAKTTSSMAHYCAQLFKILKSCQFTDSQKKSMTMELACVQVVQQLRTVRDRRKKVLLVGNGGSSAIVSHMANDLSKCDRIRAVVCTEPSLLTALTNDEGYESAYSMQVDLHGDKEDFLVAVSSSGESENILAAVAAARRRGMGVVTLSGFKPSNSLRTLGDVNLYVDSLSYGMVELAHSIFCHYLTDDLSDEK